MFKAWLAITIAFGLILTPSLGTMQAYLVAAISVATGFLFHEIAHKYFAQKYGCFAEFRSDDKMLVFAVLLAWLVGIVLAAPGAVVIRGHLTRKQNGKVSVAGPATNLAIALITLSVFLLTGFTLIKYVAMVNAFLGFFNLLPFGILDGRKVYRWNKNIYAGVMVAAVALVLLSSLL